METRDPRVTLLTLGSDLRCQNSSYSSGPLPVFDGGVKLKLFDVIISEVLW